MKQFIVDRHATPNTPTLEQVPTEKIPIYDDLDAVEADLANLTEGQIVATKDTGDELSHPVNVVESGNLHAVSSNAVAESLSYSTTEQKTGGVWIDGKPIYRRVFTANSVTSDNYLGTITNLDTPIKLEVFARNNADGNWLPRSYGVYQQSGNPQSRIDANGKVFFTVYNYTVNKIIAIVEYTKTTD